MGKGRGKGTERKNTQIIFKKAYLIRNKKTSEEGQKTRGRVRIRRVHHLELERRQVRNFQNHSEMGHKNKLLPKRGIVRDDKLGGAHTRSKLMTLGKSTVGSEPRKRQRCSLSLTTEGADD